MENVFIPYEQALDLKELGFDEPCFGYRDSSGNLMIKKTPHCVISTPTYSQAFRFFRKKYFLHSYITCSCTVNEILSYDWTIHKVMNNGTREENFISDYERTYEDAELECLKKLIEITKGKK